MSQLETKLQNLLTLLDRYIRDGNLVEADRVEHQAEKVWIKLTRGDS